MENSEIKPSILLNALSALIAIVPYSSSIGLLSINSSNMIIAMIIFATYLFKTIANKKIRYIEIFSLLITLIPMTINQSLSMISIPLIIMLYFLYKDSIFFKKYIETYFLFSAFLFLVVVISNIIFGINDVYNVDMWRIDRMIHRKSLGFLHPNIAMMAFMAIPFSYVSLLKKEQFRLNIFFIGLVSYACFYFTQSRTSAYAIAFLVISLFLLGGHAFNNIGKGVRIIVILTPIILLILSLVILFIPNNELINLLFSGRQTLYQSFYDSIGGLKWLSSPELENAMFDNGYLHALLSKGIIFTMILIIIYTTILLICSKNMNYIQAIITVVFFMIAFTETSLFRFELFFPVLLAIQRKNVKLIFRR